MTPVIKLILIIFLPWIVAFFALRHRLRFRLFSFAGIFAVQLLAIAPMAYIAAGTIADRQEMNSNVQLASIYSAQYRVSQQQLHGLTGWQGVDITAGCGSPIYAPFSGTVTYVGLDGYNHVDDRGVVWEQATMLTIQGNNDLELTLLHGDYSAQIGSEIATGQQIGKEASHGWSTGCHSHVILKQNGQTLNFLDWQNEQKQDRHLAIITTSDKPLKISWYDPLLGGINCDSDCTTMASGVKVTEDRYGNTAACLREWIGQTVVIPGIGEFKCLDTGGAIIEHPDYIYIDLLLHEPLPNAPWGTMIYDWSLEWR